MILKNVTAVAGFAILLCSAAPAFATKTVTSPYVTKGKATVEWRGGLVTDDDGEDVFKTRNQFAYGFTDFYEMKLSVDTRDDDAGMFNAFDVENKFQLLPKGEHFIDLGLRLDYVRSLNGGADEVGGKILLGKKTGEFSHLMNFETGREVGEDSSDDWGYGFSYGIAYPLTETVSLGGEWYSDFGTLEDDSDEWDEQEHMVGPVLYGTAFEKIKYQAGVLAGVSESAPDATLKTTISYSFQF